MKRMYDENEIIALIQQYGGKKYKHTVVFHDDGNSGARAIKYFQCSWIDSNPDTVTDSKSMVGKVIDYWALVEYAVIAANSGEIVIGTCIASKGSGDYASISDGTGYCTGNKTWGSVGTTFNTNYTITHQTVTEI